MTVQLSSANGFESLLPDEPLLGHHQGVDVPAHVGTARSGLLQKTLEEDLCGIFPHVPPDDLVSQHTEQNWVKVSL